MSILPMPKASIGDIVVIKKFDGESHDCTSIESKKPSQQKIIKANYFDRWVYEIRAYCSQTDRYPTVNIVHFFEEKDIIYNLTKSL